MDITKPVTSKDEYLKKYSSKDSDQPDAHDQTNTISKAEYLKKYVSGNDPALKPKKKRRKKVHKANQGYGIIDDDMVVKHSFASADASDHGGSEDEVPLVVSVEDDYQFRTKLDPRNWTVVGGIDDSKKQVELRNSKLQSRHDLMKTISTKHSTNDDMHVKKYFHPSQTSRVRHDSGSDQSPQRTSRGQHNSDSDQSLPRTSKGKHASGSDQLPSRTSKVRHDDSSSDHSPPRTLRIRHDSSSDQSVPRKSKVRHDSGSDQSPPRPTRVKQDSGSDKSPPRKSKVRHDSSSDQSPPRTGVKCDSHSVTSQSRLSKESLSKQSSLQKSKQRHDSDDDQSPPRVRKSRSDLSPRQGSSKKYDSGSAMSVPRQSQIRQHSDSDQSPPRAAQRKQSPRRDSSFSELRRSDARIRQHSPQSSRDKYSRSNDKERTHKGGERRHEKKSTLVQSAEKEHVKRRHHSSDSDLSPPRSSKINPNRGQKSYDRTLPHSSRSSQEDISQRRHDRENTRKDQERPVKTLSGLKAGLQTAKVLRTELEEAKTKEKEQFKEIGAEVLGKGAQTVFRDRSTGKLRDLKKETEEEQMKKAKEDEMKAKYTRWGKGLKQQDDQRKQVEEELYEMTKPLARYEGDEDLEKHLKEQEREGDPMLQFMRKKKMEGKTQLPSYQGPPPPPNRFNIMPGYRWDGVDRSNGFEKKLFERQSNRIALDEEAYKWSTENM